MLLLLWGLKITTAEFRCKDPANDLAVIIYIYAYAVFCMNAFELWFAKL